MGVAPPGPSSISNRVPAGVRIRFRVWLLAFTALGWVEFGTAPTMTGRSGSPLTQDTMTSVPFSKGKCMPPWGSASRTGPDAWPPAASSRSNFWRIR